MGIMYVIGLVLALTIGGGIALALRTSYYGRIASDEGEYEKDAAQSREFYANVARFRQIRRIDPGDDEASAA
jgi:hypothetical protein